MSKSDRLILSKNLQNLLTKQEGFIKAVEQLKDFSNESIINLDLEIESKNTELKELTKRFKNEETDGKIQCDQNIQKYKYDAAIAILGEKNEIAIDKSNYDNLKSELSILKLKDKTEIDKLLKKERETGDRKLKYALDNCLLKHKAEHAELTAAVKQRDNQIITLQNSIENLKIEIAAQRELTKSVAEAGKQGQISQTFGK
jgi:hypothetical protein